MTEQLPPADWYPDPEGGTGIRYWDGTQWTEHRAAGPATTSSDVSPVPRKRRGWLALLAVALVVVLVGVVIFVATGTSSKSSKPGADGSSNGATNAAQPGLDRDAQIVQATVADVLLELGVAKQHPTTENKSQLARAAQEAHDSLNSAKDAIARDIDKGNTKEANLADAVTGLTNSMGALVTYARTPNRATLASFTKQYQPAVAEWNNAVRAIYDATGKALPTMPTA